MKKFEGILFCTDLDGTLFSDDKTVSRKNRDAIEYFKSEGGLFTFVTGRVPQTASAVCEIVGPNAPIGCNNGGGVYDPVAKKYLWRTYLPDTAMEMVAEVDRELPDVGIQLNTEQTVWFCKDNSALVHVREIKGLPYVACPYREVTDPVLKVLFAHEDARRIEQVAELLAHHPLKDTVDFIRSELNLYDILPKGVSKGTALARLAEILAIPIERTIAVGDYNNDVAMLRTAGVSFAVANAVPEAKAAARYETVSNNEDAIAAIVDLLDGGKLLPFQKA